MADPRLISELLPLALCYAEQYRNEHKLERFHPEHNRILWKAIPDPDARKRLGLWNPTESTPAGREGRE